MALLQLENSILLLMTHTRHKHRHRQTDRQTHKQAGRQTDRLSRPLDLSPSLPPSLPPSQRNTHTHIHTHTLTYSLSHSLKHTSTHTSTAPALIATTESWADPAREVATAQGVVHLDNDQSVWVTASVIQGETVGQMHGGVYTTFSGYLLYSD